MDAVFLKLINMSLTASWLCLAVLLVRLLLKKAPKAISCALWALVGLRLLLPFSLESVLSLVPSAEPLPEDMLLSPTPTINSGIPVVNEVINPVISQGLAPNPGDSVNPMQVITTVAGYIWVIGMSAMLIYTAVSYLRLRHRVREAVRIEGNIYECDHISTPFILGVIRPRIYLPSGMEAEDRAFVVAHEQAHLRRLDHVWKPLGFVLLSVHWFNPLLWLGYILLCRDIELACDERVIRELGTDIKKSYSAALLSCSVPRRAISACPLAFGEVGVKGRIKSVLNYKKPAFWIILVAVVALAVTGVCFLTDPPKAIKDPSAGTEGPTKYDFTDIDYYEWTGEYSKDAHLAAISGYVQDGKQPVSYPNGSLLRNVQISVPFTIESCEVISPGPVPDGNADHEYTYRTYTYIPTYIEGTTAYIDISGWHRHISSEDILSKYTIWSYIVKIMDTENVEHYYYFRVDYSRQSTSETSSNQGISQYTAWDITTIPEITLPGFGGTKLVFEKLTSFNHQIKMVDQAGKEALLFAGPTAKKAAFADLNQDGYLEFLLQASPAYSFSHKFTLVYDIKNGRFYRLEQKDVYDFSLSTENGTLSVSIFDRENRKYLPTATPMLTQSDGENVLALYDGEQVLYVAPENTSSETFLLRIRQDYAAFEGGVPVPMIEVYVVASFDNVYAVFIGYGNSNTVITYENVGGLTFRYPTSQHMLIYHNGSFCSIADAYQRGVLTDETLLSLHTTYHARFSH